MSKYFLGRNGLVFAARSSATCKKKKGVSDKKDAVSKFIELFGVSLTTPLASTYNVAEKHSAKKRKTKAEKGGI